MILSSVENLNLNCSAFCKQTNSKSRKSTISPADLKPCQKINAPIYHQLLISPSFSSLAHPKIKLVQKSFEEIIEDSDTNFDDDAKTIVKELYFNLLDSLSIENLLLICKTNSKKNSSNKLNEVVKIIKKFKEENNVSLSNVDIEFNEYGCGEFNLNAQKDENESVIKNTYKIQDFQLCSTEQKFFKKHENKTYEEIIHSEDYVNNKSSDILVEINPKYDDQEVIKEVRTIKNSSREEVRKEILTQSTIPGIIDEIHVFPDGKTPHIISKGFKDPITGKTSIKKNMVSPSGVKTYYRYEDKLNGDRKFVYQITDKNGKVLMRNVQTFKVDKKNPNQFESTINGTHFDITYKKGKVIICDKNDKKAKPISIDLSKLTNSSDNNVIELIKTIPAHEIAGIKTNKVKSINVIDSNYRDAFYYRDTKSISLANSVLKSKATLLHELGHSKEENPYYDEIIAENASVQRVFEKERSEFMHMFPDAQRNHIKYFTVADEYDDITISISEAVAELNALLNVSYDTSDTAMRSHLLQQYFPKTIAKVYPMLYERNY